MLREYQLTNFKAFAGPETIPIRPLTLIFGPNSSGKSSILQSLLLLKQTLEEAENSETLLLPKGTLVDLGSYREFVHRHNTSNKFSFQAAFEIDMQTIEQQPIRQLLGSVDPVLAGLRIVFAYNEEVGNLILSSTDVFIGDESSPMIAYTPFQVINVAEELRSSLEMPDGGKVLQVGEINLQHGFWRTWWTVTKQRMEKKLQEASTIMILGEEEELSPEKFQQYLEHATFEEALESFKKANEFSFLSCRNFLPDRVLREPDPEDLPFNVEFFPSDDTRDRRQRPDISPLTLSVCSLFRQFVRSIVYLGPLRDNPERYYIVSDNPSKCVGKSGKIVPYILSKDPKLVKQVNAQFGRLGLKYELRLAPLKDDAAESTSVFAIRLVDKETGMGMSIADVGFGISQVLPIIVQSMLSHNTTLLIEQPELHLHPALQAELGDLFIQSALGEQQNTFLLETHSEHLMLRILRRIRETTEGELEPGLTPIRPEQVAVLYVLPGKDGAKIVEIPIRPDGEFAERWPQGFFAERAEELF